MFATRVRVSHHPPDELRPLIYLERPGSAGGAPEYSLWVDEACYGLSLSTLVTLLFMCLFSVYMFDHDITVNIETGNGWDVQSPDSAPAGTRPTPPQRH